jgi:transcriptional coactivator HFI1/ADA1
MATIRPNDIAMSTTPTLATKNLPSPSPALRPERKITAPRIDIEPLYTAIKSAISDADWTIYKSSISQFLLGNLNQEELSSKLDRILSTPALEHAHNQFVLSIYANSFRDAPEPGTASWADDKVVGKSGGAGGKAGHNQGDETEKRLKHEVMQLPRRERKRLKTLQENPYDAFANGMAEYHDMRRIRQPDTGPASAGGFQKTSTYIASSAQGSTPRSTLLAGLLTRALLRLGH